MNERIRELAGRALDKVVPYTWTTLDYDEIQKLQEKFAELIVRECADIAKHHVMNITTYSDANFVDEQIREHFGVK